MQDNQVKILGGFLSQGELTYKEGEFKGFIAQPEQNKAVTLSFSEHCIDQIQFLQHIKSGMFSKDAYFSIIFTDGRELKVKANEKTYQKIYEKSLSSRKTPTLIIEEPFDLIKIAKWLAVGILVLGGIAYCNSDPKTTSVENNTIVQSPSPAPSQPIIYSPQKLCKAGVSSLFFDKIKAIKVDKISGNINYLHAKRATDGVVWRYACKIVGNTIVLAGIDVFHRGTNEQSRWMDDYAAGDAKLNYSANAETKQLTIHLNYSDGSSTTKIFEFKEFSRSK